MGNIVDVCYRSPDSEEAEDLLGQLEKASCSQAQVLMGYICWKGNTVKQKQSWSFLECIDGNFLTQVIKELAWGGTLLKLMFMNKEKLLRDVKVVDSHGCSDQKVIRFRIQRGRSRAGSQPGTSGEPTWASFRNEYKWIQFQRDDRSKSYFQGSSPSSRWIYPTCQKPSKGSRKPAWVILELLTKHVTNHGKEG